MLASETTCIGCASPIPWRYKPAGSLSAPRPPHARIVPDTAKPRPSQNRLARQVRSPNSCAGFYSNCPRVVVAGWSTENWAAGPLADRPVLETKHAPEMRRDSTYWTLYDLG